MNIKSLSLNHRCTDNTRFLYHTKLFLRLLNIKDFWGGSVIKSPPVNAEDAGDTGSVPRLGRSPGEMAIHSSLLAWEIPWTEEPGGLQSMGSQRIRHDLATKQQQPCKEPGFGCRFI